MPEVSRFLALSECLIWALNELFQMKILPFLRKQFTFFNLFLVYRAACLWPTALRRGV